MSAEGTSKDAVQYITIDGVEYKLAGSDIKYQELAGVSLDEITATGVYAITGALDTPANTANKGTLVVTKLTDTIIQDEDDIINTHMEVVKQDAKLLTEEGRLISLIKGIGTDEDKIEIDEYIQRLDNVLDQKMNISVNFCKDYQIIKESYIIFLRNLFMKEIFYWVKWMAKVL